MKISCDNVSNTTDKQKSIAMSVETKFLISLHSFIHMSFRKNQRSRKRYEATT